MFIKIYFNDKPVFLCDKKNPVIDRYLNRADTIFINEISSDGINTLLQDIAKPAFQAGILLGKDLDKLKKDFYKHLDLILAAGGIVMNEKEEILMIFRRGKWDLPKGKLDDGETLEECAVREVEEETGLANITLGEKLSTTYHVYKQFGKHILKESHWYNMKCDSNQKLTPQTEEDITEIKWVNNAEVEKYFSNTYQTIIEVIEELRIKIN